MVQDKKAEKENKAINVNKMIDSYVEKAHNALDEMANFNQEQVDKICEASPIKITIIIELVDELIIH